MHNGELEVQGRKKGHVLAQAVAVLNSQINRRILRFRATPQTEQVDIREPGSRRGKPGDQEKRRHQEGGWQDTTVQQSFLL